MQIAAAHVVRPDPIDVAHLRMSLVNVLSASNQFRTFALDAPAGPMTHELRDEVFKVGEATARGGYFATEAIAAARRILGTVTMPPALADAISGAANSYAQAALYEMGGFLLGLSAAGTMPGADSRALWNTYRERSTELARDASAAIDLLDRTGWYVPL